MSFRKLAQFSQEPMQLQLAIISLESPHFDDRCLLQVVQSQLLALKVIHILNYFGQSIDYVSQVVAFVEHKIDVRASIRKAASDALFHNVDHQIWMRLVANFENVLFIYFIEPSGCRLKIV